MALRIIAFRPRNEEQIRKGLNRSKAYATQSTGIEANIEAEKIYDLLSEKIKLVAGAPSDHIDLLRTARLEEEREIENEIEERKALGLAPKEIKGQLSSILDLYKSGKSIREIQNELKAKNVEVRSFPTIYKRIHAGIEKGEIEKRQKKKDEEKKLQQEMKKAEKEEQRRLKHEALESKKLNKDFGKAKSQFKRLEKKIPTEESLHLNKRQILALSLDKQPKIKMTQAEYKSRSRKH